MQITENLLLGKTRHGYGITYEGLLLPNLQPVLYAVGEGSRSCIYFSQFGNNFFLRPWTCEQDKLDNIVKLGEASHKIIKKE